jgi:Tol biopolymer transport system component
MNRDGGDVTRITFVSPRPDAFPYEHVAVSFDRKMIAADRNLQGGSGPTGLWVIDLERKTEARLVPSFFTAGNGGVDWSPDGFIVFAGKRKVGENEGIFRIRADGSQLTQLVALDVADPGFVGDVSVSEDGSLLAYVRAVSMQGKLRMVLKTQIWVARSDGSEQRMVDDGGPELGNQGGFPIGDFDPEISPDNKHVVFSRTNMQHVSFKDTFNNAQDLWVAALDGSQPARRLTQPGPISIVADWHDGKIVFTEYNEAEDFFGLVLINPDGTGYRRLEPSLHLFRNCGRHGKWILGAPSPPSR